MASTLDKITDTRNAARPNSARVSSGRSAAGVTLICDNLSGWPIASKVHFVTYQIDSNSNPIAGTQLDCYGIVSGNNIGSLAVIDGNDTGNSIGDVVEMLPTAAWGQDLADALTVAHERTGIHKSGATYPLPVIADFTNATHNHTNTAGGGKITSAGITSLDLSLTTLSNPYKFSVYRNAAANTGNNTLALITFDTKIFDTGTNYDISTGKFTAPVAGFYQFSFSSGFTATGGFCVLALYKNGVEYHRGVEIVSAGNTDTQLTGAALVQLAANDYTQVFVQSPAANPLQIGSNRNYFTGFLVSQT